MLYELIFFMHDILSNILPIDNNKIKYIYYFKLIIMFIVVKLDVVLGNNKHILTHFMSWHAMLAGQWPTQMLYKKMLGIQKECYQPNDFCGAADMSARDIVYALFILEL